MAMNDIFRKDADRVLKALPQGLSVLQGKRLLLTGATGFIGKGLLDSLIRAMETGGLRCRVGLPLRGGAARLAGQIPDSAIDCFELVDWSLGTLPELFEGDFDYLVHAAGPVDVSRYRENPGQLMREMVATTEQVLELAARGIPRKLLYLSSGAVYGDFYDQTGGPVGEACNTAPSLDDWRSCYGEAKRYCELLVAGQGYGTVSARVFSVMGPHLDLRAPFALADFIRQAEEQGRIQLNSDGSAARSFLYQADLSVGLWNLLLASEAHGGYNLGSDHVIRIRDLAEIVAAQFPGTGVQLGEQIDSLRNYYVPDVSRTGPYCSSTISLEEGVARTVIALRQQGRLGN